MSTAWPVIKILRYLRHRNNGSRLKSIHFGDDIDVLFGPAYKGIPLSVAASIAYSKLYGKELRYCSNRKEEKDHGDTGILLGSKLKDGDRVVIIEDVTTAWPVIKILRYLRHRNNGSRLKSIQF